MDAVFPNISLMGEQKNDDASLKKAIAEFLKNTEGIEAWKDVSYEWTEDGRIHFVGTGYFADIAALKFHNIGFMDFAWKAQGSTGQLTMEFSQDESDDKPDPIATDPKKRAEEIKAERAKFQQSKPMMAGVMAGMSHVASFTLPGKPGKTQQFTTTDNGKLTLKITGDQLLSAMEKLIHDDEWMQKNSLNIEQGPSDAAAFNESLFGGKGPAIAQRTAINKPIFSYTQELAAAKKDFDELQASLGTKIGPAASGDPFTSLQVVGVRHISDIDADAGSGFRPFNHSPGLTFSLLGEFSGSVLEVTNESKLEKAIANDGSNLLPTNQFNRQINFPRLSENRSKVLFEVNLAPPGESVTGIQEIAGTVQYIVAQGTKEVDLGFAAIEPNQKGKELSAEITSIKEGWRKNGGEEMEIQLDVEITTLKELVLIDGKKRITLEKRGHSSFGNAPASFTFESNVPFPKNGKLVAIVHDQIETYNIPFKLENLTLLGKKAE